MSNSNTNQLLGSLFTDITMQKAMKDKLEQETSKLQQASQEEVDVHAGLDDDELDALLNDDDFDAIREQRLKAMKAEHNKQQENRVKGHGEYREITEQEFLKEVTGSALVVCHFYHRDFERCKIVDKHLRILALRHPEAKFICINADKAPFFVVKLVVMMLPTVVLFKDGVAVDRVVGFDELGARDDFSTRTMAERIAKSGVIEINDQDCDDEDDD